MSHGQGHINEEEFLLLYNLQFPKKLYLPYWKNERFNNVENNECISEFRFKREGYFVLKDVLQVPDQLICYNGTSVSSIEETCIFLKRYAYS